MSFIITPKVCFGDGPLGCHFWKCFETQHLLAIHFGCVLRRILYPLESGMNTLKDRVLPSYFVYYKKNYIFNESDKSSLDYQRRMRKSHLEIIPILISIQDFFAIVHSNYYMHYQLSYKSYAIISAYYLRLDLAVSNNKSFKGTVASFL